MTDRIPEPEAREFAAATAKPPFLYELGPEKARKALDDVQAGDVRVRILKPNGVSGPLPVILYVHGGGWILGLPAVGEPVINSALWRQTACTRQPVPIPLSSQLSHTCSRAS